MKYYYLNIVNEVILRTTSKFLHDHQIETYGLTEINRVGLGEALGPLSQQRELFPILGTV